jgi:hypothetical protein
LIKIDTLGNEQWRKVYGIQDYNTGEGLRQTSDSGFVIAGITSINNAEEDVYIIKTDKNGYANPYIGINPISNQIPIESRLFQNHPNPFNSFTIIKFQISKQGFTKLRIYDALGREVSIPVDEKVQPGTYELSVNSGNISSGVYFCRLEVNGALIDTKKMVLIK